jgi:thiol peroxidase
MKHLSLAIVVLLLSACATKVPMKVSTSSITPGTSVKLKGNTLELYKGKLTRGDNFSQIIKKTHNIELAKKVTIISVVPSVDTKVCEEQTHILGETKIHPDVNLVTISRDLPMAQTRFAKEAKLENITYISDYKDASFGQKTGFLINESALLTRGVLVVDKAGKVVYMQFVDEITELPDMYKAIKFANNLAEK